MRLSKAFIPTEKDDRADAVVASHRLMIRAGMIRQLTSGVYSQLPLGLRAARKVAQIVREEMDRAGAQEVFLPALQPADLWKESGRWTFYGPELMRIKDRNDRDFCLGPTHEEVMADLVRPIVKSYRQLPFNLYQIQTKFRDERRPRFGVMRGREFTMKDAYSFDATEESANQSYKAMYDAYCRIFERCGLRFRAVEADSGSIGGSFSHEFMVLADSGEDAIVSCNSCDYAANIERAEVPAPDNPTAAAGTLREMEKKVTPDMKTVEDVCGFLGIEPKRLIKTLIYRCDEDRAVAVLVRGDREANEIKVQRHLGCESIEMADEALVRQVTGAPMGFAGPVGLKEGPGGNRVTILADSEVRSMTNAVVGANEADAHLLNVNAPRDFQPDEYGDFRVAVAGDPCPRCENGKLEIWRGIEVGHVFKLGTKYSKPLNATYQDENGEERLIIMGSYGIGIERTVAAAIEQNHDDKGIIFPMPIAPYQVLVLCIQPDIPEVMQAAEKLYTELKDRGIDTLLDDRDERPGSKFNDADLIGIPLRINVGSRGLKEGKVELKLRATGDMEDIPVDRAIERVLEIIRDQTQ